MDLSNDKQNDSKTKFRPAYFHFTCGAHNLQEFVKYLLYYGQDCNYLKRLSAYDFLCCRINKEIDQDNNGHCEWDDDDNLDKKVDEVDDCEDMPGLYSETDDSDSDQAEVDVPELITDSESNSDADNGINERFSLSNIKNPQDKQASENEDTSKTHKQSNGSKSDGNVKKDSKASKEVNFSKPVQSQKNDVIATLK